jgi:hypothetical protein
MDYEYIKSQIFTKKIQEYLINKYKQTASEIILIGYNGKLTVYRKWGFEIIWCKVKFHNGLFERIDIKTLCEIFKIIPKIITGSSRNNKINVSRYHFVEITIDTTIRKFNGFDYVSISAENITDERKIQILKGLYKDICIKRIEFLNHPSYNQPNSFDINELTDGSETNNNYIERRKRYIIEELSDDYSYSSDSNDSDFMIEYSE